MMIFFQDCTKSYLEVADWGLLFQSNRLVDTHVFDTKNTEYT